MADKNFKVKSGLNIPITSAAILTTDSSGNISSTNVLPISAGGTGQTSATNAINALLPVQNGGTVNYAIQSDGSNVNWGKLYNQTIKNNGTTVNPRGIINIVGASFADDSGTDSTTLTLNPAIKTIDEKTANYTVQTSDNNKILEVNSSSNTTITIPTNTMDSIPNGTTISLVNKGTGNINFIGSTSSLPLSENTSSAGSFIDVDYGNGIFVGVSSNTIYTSTDGINWTSRTGGESIIRAVRFLQNKFYITSGSSTGRIKSSTDGVSWTTVYSASSSDIKDIAYGNGKFIAVSSDSKILTSTDGTTWTLISGVAGTTTQDFQSVIYIGSDTWYLSLSASPWIIRSTDNGDTWNSLSVTGIGAGSTPSNFYYNGTTLLLRLAGSVLGSVHSSNGESWNATSGVESLSSGLYFHSFIQNGSTFYMLINGTFNNPTTAYLYSSTDLITWTLSTTLNLSEAANVSRKGAVSDSGIMLWTSSNKTKSYTTGTESSTIYSLDSSKTVSKRYAKVDLYKYNSNNWVLTGDLDSKTVDVELNSEQYYNLMGVF